MKLELKHLSLCYRVCFSGFTEATFLHVHVHTVHVWAITEAEPCWTDDVIGFSTFCHFFFLHFFYLPSVIEPLFWLVFLSSVGCFVFLFSSFLMFASDAESFQGQSQTVLLKWVQDIVLQTVLADLRARLSDVSLQNSRFHLLWVQTKRNKLDVSPTLTVTLRTF